MSVEFTNTSTGGETCLWDFGDGSVFEGCGIVVYDYEGVDSYDVTLTVTTQFGCVASDTYFDYISLVPGAIASFDYAPNQITVLDTEIEFTNTSLNSNGCQWYFNDGSSVSTIDDPIYTFPLTGNATYEVILVAENAAGCPDTISEFITVEDEILFFVPNTFTPDGNAHNQTFQPVFTSGYDPYDFHLTIFNRWGQLIFESYNADKGWEGSYGGNEITQDGIYTWKIDFRETMTDRRHMHVGHVTLIK